MTYQNLGYWIGQANDLSTGSHPSGWTNGQRWSETASEWLAMYTQSQTDLANMTADRNYWKTTVAHDDPNVYTNRYNAGYAQATTDKQPPASVLAYDTALGTSGAISRGVWTTMPGSWTVTISGYYALFGEVRNYSANANDSIDYAYLRFAINGSPNAEGQQGHRYSVDTPSMHSVFTHYFLSAGQVVTLQVNHSANQSGTQCTFGQGVIKARFVPTQGQPH